MGPSFNAGQEVTIFSFPAVARGEKARKRLTRKGSNNAFPSTNPDGNFVPSDSFPNSNYNRIVYTWLLAELMCCSRIGGGLNLSV